MRRAAGFGAAIILIVGAGCGGSAADEPSAEPESAATIPATTAAAEPDAAEPGETRPAAEDRPAATEEATDDKQSDEQMTADADRPSFVRIMWTESEAVEASFLLRRPVQGLMGGAVGPDGLFYGADRLGGRIVRIDLDGTVTGIGPWPSTDQFSLAEDPPKSIAFDPDGVLHVANHWMVYRVGDDGELTHVPMNGVASGGLTFGPDGTMYAADRPAGLVYRVEPGGRTEVITTEAELPESLTMGPDGMLYASVLHTSQIQRIDPATGAVTQLFTDPEPSGSINFLAFDSEGDLWARPERFLMQYTTDGAPKPFTIDGQQVERFELPQPVVTSADIAFDIDGSIWLPGLTGHVMYLEAVGDDEFVSHTVIEGFAAWAMTVGPDGSVYVHNWINGELLRIRPDGSTRTMQVFPALDPVALASDPATGQIFIGLPDGTVAELDTATGDTRHIADMAVVDLAVGGDGELYGTALAVDGSGADIDAIVRISRDGTTEVLTDELAGERIRDIRAYGAKGLEICPAPDGLYAMSETSYNYYFVDTETGVATLLGNSAIEDLTEWTYYCVSSPGGTLYLTGYSTFAVGEPDLTLISRNHEGDPIAAGISPDGRYLYIAGSGAVHQILLPGTPMG